MGTGTKLGLQILVPEQNMDFKYGYRTKMWILFWFQYLKSKFCSGTHFWSPHFVLVTIFWEPNSVPVTCFWEGGCLKIFRKSLVCYDKISLLRFFNYLSVISGQNRIQCINKNCKLTVSLMCQNLFKYFTSTITLPQLTLTLMTPKLIPFLFCIESSM